MMQTVLLGDEIELIGGGTPNTSNPEYWNGNIPWLSVVDFGGNSRWVKTAEKSITETGLKNSSTKLLDSGDIIISARGTVGELAQLQLPMAFNQSCYGIRAKEGLDQNFLYYLIKYSIADLQRQAHGGVFNTITRETFQHIKVSLPSHTDQIRIADILGTLDEKIELNRRMNETLEQIGQATFQHYFIDNPEVKAWPVIELGNYVELVNGASYKSSELKSSANALVTLKSFSRGGGFRRDGFKEFTGTIKDPQVVTDGDIVVAHTDVTQKAEIAGVPALVTGTSKYEKVGISMDVVKVNSTDDNISSAFLYFLLRSRAFQDHKMGYISGTTVLHLNKKCIPSYKLRVPTDSSVLKAISDSFIPVVKSIAHNEDQTDSLVELRDSLLPRLISGKIKV